MGCRCGARERREREVAIVLLRESLLYDIRNNVYVAGDVMSEDEYHRRHMVQDAGEDGNRDIVTRMLDLGHAECEELLGVYTKRRVRAATVDDRPRERERYLIEMLVPEEFPETRLLALKELTHQYIVARATAHWLSLTHPDRGAEWEAKRQELAREIKRKPAMYAGKLRRRMTPL